MISNFNGTSTPKGSYSDKTRVNCTMINVHGTGFDDNNKVLSLHSTRGQFLECIFEAMCRYILILTKLGCFRRNLELQLWNKRVPRPYLINMCVLHCVIKDGKSVSNIINFWSFFLQMNVPSFLTKRSKHSDTCSDTWLALFFHKKFTSRWR